LSQGFITIARSTHAQLAVEFKACLANKLFRDRKALTLQARTATAVSFQQIQGGPQIEPFVAELAVRRNVSLGMISRGSNGISLLLLGKVILVIDEKLQGQRLFELFEDLLGIETFRDF
jgi:hypothetical protein